MERNVFLSFSLLWPAQANSGVLGLDVVGVLVASLALDEGVDVLDGGLGDVVQRVDGEEGLVARHHHIGEREQPRQHRIRNDLPHTMSVRVRRVRWGVCVCVCVCVRWCVRRVRWCVR